MLRQLKGKMIGFFLFHVIETLFHFSAVVEMKVERTEEINFSRNFELSTSVEYQESRLSGRTRFREK